MKITLPELCLVVLVGTSGSGKSTFAKKHFLPTEVLSSDFCRGLVSDDENSQSATKDAFEVLHFIASKRLKAAKLTVVDATNVQPESRKPLVTLAREQNCLPVAIVLNVPEKVCQQRNSERQDRNFGPHVIKQQNKQLNKNLRRLEREGFRRVFVLSEQQEIDEVVIGRQPLWNNLKTEQGPFDIIGDIHGCYDELYSLLLKLGYKIDSKKEESPGVVTPPAGRKAVFVGDLVDRGPRTPDVLKLVMAMVRSNSALCVPGNHDAKLMRALKGRKVKLTNGLAESLEQLQSDSDEFKTDVISFIDGLVGHYVLDQGNLVVAHAGMKEEYQGRASGRVREFALYGETTGETDEYGLPVRYNWAMDYRGKAMVVYGHTPVPEAQWLNNTICVDTGCVFGGKLSALRYPEKELVHVDAEKVYYEPVKPLVSEVEGNGSLDRAENILDIKDVSGKRIIDTSLRNTVTVREENAIAALEVMSRYAVNPNWLIYLPPTMSPCETSSNADYLEYPVEAFNHYRKSGVKTVVCQQKHMGSRAIVIVGKDEDAVAKRFGIVGEGKGVCYTRTGRRFFNNKNMESDFISSICDSLTSANFFDEYSTDWVALDCELMPWSDKAQELLKDQYAAVGVAASNSLKSAVSVLEQAAKRSAKAVDFLERYKEKQELVSNYIDAYRNYCWTVNSLSDLKLAPFHLLATEGKVYMDRDHHWHMNELAKLADASDNSLIMKTAYRTIDLDDEKSVDEGVAWWLELTATGAEGMVVKPLHFISRGGKGLVQPAIKCRGKEYLRIIYGPEYTMKENLERLRARKLSKKRSLALREFALGAESLERFVRREPLYRVHECVFGVLALESEPVDPRL